MGGNPLPEGIRGASNAPIQRCLVQEHLFENGKGVLVLARGLSPTRVTIASFLLDVYCLGIKNVIFRTLEASELAYFITKMEATSPFVAMEPCDARKLLRLTLSPRPDRERPEPEKIRIAVRAALGQTIGEIARGFGPWEKTALAALWLVPLVARTLPQLTLIPLACVTMTSLGLLLGTAFEARNLGLMFGFVVLPLTFLGGTYYQWTRLAPVKAGPVHWLQIVVLVNPLIYINDGMRAAFTDAAHMHLYVIYPAIVAFSVIFLALGLKNFRRKVLA